jgi:hypothetical protein
MNFQISDLGERVDDCGNFSVLKAPWLSLCWSLKVPQCLLFPKLAIFVCAPNLHMTLLSHHGFPAIAW